MTITTSTTDLLGAATLAEVASLHAGTRAGHAALVCEGRRVEYATLAQVSLQVANGLRAAGLRPGDRLAYLGKESECYYELLLGAARCGAVLVPINWRLAPAEVAHILADSGTSLLFVDEDAAPAAERVVSGLSQQVSVVHLDRPGAPRAGFTEWVARHPAVVPLHRVRPDDAVVQMYTSGTTGLPKGVVLAHRTFFAVPAGLAATGLDWIDWRPDDRSLVAVPGFHIGGLWWTVQGLLAGVTNIIMPAFHPGDAIDLVTSLDATVVGAVPAMLRQMLAQPGVDGATFRTVRKVYYGGSPISDTLLAQCIEVVGCEFVQFYGLTESGNTVLCLPPADHVVGGPRMKAAGVPYPGIEVCVVDRDGNRLPAGEIGEICLRTPGAMLEYWQRPDATAAALVDGWLHTGDAGVLDEDGYVFIRDRIKDMVIVEGENVYPAEVENALCAHPSVADAAVIGVPDERWGEAVYAFVVPVDGASVVPADLAEFLRSRLAPFKVPVRYEVIDAVPRNPSGKILHRELREPFWRGRDRAVN